jgi:chemotaxis protein methyltransferase CheR
MNRALEQVARLVHAETGIRLKESQYPALRGAVARASGDADPAAFLRLASDPVVRTNALGRLIDEVTVGETFFLRDRRQLETIDWPGARERAGARPVRVWSAACSTGEEAYSLALLATEAFFPARPPVRILATDISQQALAAARLGVYRSRAVRELEPQLRARYLREDDGRYVVADRLRECVSFARHNLVHDPIPPLDETSFDVIVCRNVFIYFDAETCERVLAAMEGALGPGGQLVLGVADALCRATPQLGRLTSLPAPKTPTAKPTQRRNAARRPRPGSVPALQLVGGAKEYVAAALHAADAGRPDDGLVEATKAVVADPMNAYALFVRGLLELDLGDAKAAIASLRRALYANPQFGLAAFKLARAYEAAGDRMAATRSYEQALRTLDGDDERHASILGQVELGDVAAACRARLAALR